MDTSVHFYFLVQRLVHRSDGFYALDGVDFHSGLSSLILDRIREPFFLVDCHKQRRLSTTLRVIHYQRLGYLLEVPEPRIDVFPCLLTTDSQMRYAFSEPVTAVVSDACPELLDEDTLPIPVCGAQWLGLLRLSDGDLWLDAFASAATLSGVAMQAYCPEWSEYLDEDDAATFRLFPVKR